VAHFVYNVNAKEVEKEVRECDRRIVEWFITHDYLSPDDYVKIHRPSLVKVRLDIMRVFGMIDFDAEGNAYPTNLVNVTNLPINSDRIKFASKMVIAVYKVIADYSPASATEAADILSRIYRRRFAESQVRKWIANLKRTGLVKRRDDRLVAEYFIFTDDYDTLYEQWLAESEHIMELGKKMIRILNDPNMRKRRKEVDANE